MWQELSELNRIWQKMMVIVISCQESEIFRRWQEYCRPKMVNSSFLKTGPTVSESEVKVSLRNEDKTIYPGAGDWTRGIVRRWYRTKSEDDRENWQTMVVNRL